MSSSSRGSVLYLLALAVGRPAKSPKTKTLFDKRVRNLVLRCCRIDGFIAADMRTDKDNGIGITAGNMYDLTQTHSWKRGCEAAAKATSVAPSFIERCSFRSLN